MRKWITRIGIVVIILMFIGLILGNLQLRDPYPNYSLEKLIRHTSPGQMQAGFSAVTITPEITDTWNDVNGDARYAPDEGDTFNDNNGNGKFDAYWIAGFHNSRPANGIHDDLWARAMVLGDGSTRIALVVLDVIGFGHDDVVYVRSLIEDSLEIDYSIIVSTHNHQGPDLLGLWGPGYLRSGINKQYMQFVKEQIVFSLRKAVTSLRPARLKFAQDLTGATKLVTDSRKPVVLDPGIRLMQAIDVNTDTTLGVLVSWANHPETLWSRNLQITSDFPHYVREGLENGIYDQKGTLQIEGVGGIAIYLNGAIGGLMTTDPDWPVRDPFQDISYTEPSWAKAKAQGATLAKLSLQALNDINAREVNRSSIRLSARTVTFPVENRNFRIGALLGVLKRGFTGWFKMRSELAGWTIGPTSFITMPGEVYPEIINGGIESPAGADFSISPVEEPPIRDLMPGDLRFVIGLANDEIGYILPKTEWDVEPPHIYGQNSPPYGEIVSLGPETGPIFYREIKNILSQLRE